MSNFINTLSPHLFWDVDINDVDADKNKSFIIKRVLEFGFFKDWKLINEYYGIDVIVDSATKFRELEPKTLSFIIQYSGLPKEKFRCYTTAQSKIKHWNF